MILHYKPGDDVNSKLDKLKPWKNGYIIEVKKNYPIRSNQHNRYYRALLKLISIQTGIEEDVLHEIYKAKYNSKEVVMPDTSEIIRIVMSTKMDADKFSAYVAKVKQDASENHGIDMDQGVLDFQKEMEIRQQYDRVFNQY